MVSSGLTADRSAPCRDSTQIRNVVYVGTFSKVLFPALRLGYVVVPKDMVAAFSAVREASDLFSSTLYQAT